MTMAARSASTHEDRFKKYKQRKLDEGKAWPVVRNNLINKLITISVPSGTGGSSMIRIIRPGLTERKKPLNP